MQIVSVNVGLPREIEWKGRSVLTGIFKSPTERRVTMRTLNLDGDRQADLRVHGGAEKAVYAYPSEHYPFWRAALNTDELPPGAFGENLTMRGLTEDIVYIGDRFRIGTAEVVVTQPRVPCFKLAAKFRRTAIVKEFLESGRSGFYFSVRREGEVGAGDAVEWISRDPGRVSIADLNRIYRGETEDPDLIQRAVKVEALAAVWREMLIDSL
jgi:MOSC domain-containing protein YiiM